MDIQLNFQGKKAVITIEGVITTENAYLFQEKLSEVQNSEVTKLELDFSACRIISSTGIGKLLLFYKDFIAKNGEVEIVKCSPGVYELFTTIKLNQLMTISL